MTKIDYLCYICDLLVFPCGIFVDLLLMCMKYGCHWSLLWCDTEFLDRLLVHNTSDTAHYYEFGKTLTYLCFVL